MSEKLSERVRFMNALAEASFLVRKIAEPAPPGDSVKAAILRAYRRIGSWTHNRVRDVWYGDNRISVSGDELIQLRAVARQDAETSRDNELAELRERLAALEAYMRQTDNEFFVSQIHAMREVPCGDGGATCEDSTEDRRDIEGDGE